MPDRNHAATIRVLIVDDDGNHLRLLTAGLRLEGFNVEAALDAEAALGAAGRTPFDVALVDVMMPGTNGLELARRLRVERPGVRVVLMSAYHLSERQIRLSECGAVGFVAKPYRLEQLAAYLRTKARDAAVRAAS